MDKLKFTLYEFSGYVIPGVFSTIAVVLSMALLNSCMTYIPETISASVLLIFSSYVLGHFNQAIGNIFSPFFEAKVIAKRSSDISLAIKACNLPDRGDIRNFKLLMNKALMNHKVHEMDLYIEREGFYRGSFIGIIFLLIAFVSSAFLSTVTVQFDKFVMVLKLGQKIFIVLATSTAAVMYFRRYIRFLEYRVNLMIDSML